MKASLERLNEDIDRQYTEKRMRDLSLDLALIGGGRRANISIGVKEETRARRVLRLCLRPTLTSRLRRSMATSCGVTGDAVA